MVISDLITDSDFERRRPLQSRPRIYLGKVVLPTAKASVIRVYDGDTITVKLQGRMPEWLQQWAVRLYGYDAPEISDRREPIRRKAMEAKAALAKLVAGKMVVLRNIRADKYHRLLSEIFVENVSIGKELERLDLVRPYLGQGIKPW